MRLHRSLFLLALLAGAALHAQQPPADHQAQPSSPDGQQPAAATTAAEPLPDINALMHEVETNQRKVDAAARDYTYHVHSENTDMDKGGDPKKTTVIDAESLTIDGVRINRTVARNGKPLTPEETSKENDRIDKEVAKAKEHEAELASKGKATDSQGDQELTLSRILELGSFSNIRPGVYAGRPVWLIDYTGDPNAKTHNEIENAFHDLTGTVWIDQADHVLVAGHGVFAKDFKIGFGLLLDLHKGTQFDFRFTRIGDTWLRSTIDGTGSARYFLFGGFNGHLHIETSNYKRFHTDVKILPSNHLVGPDGQPLPTPGAANTPPPPETPAQP